jgi:hypothetical protein
MLLFLRTALLTLLLSSPRLKSFGLLLFINMEQQEPLPFLPSKSSYEGEEKTFVYGV